ncbi:hypothetical protein PR202_gb25069 [Eleusine coracana subsp. coracana]|uniref:Rad51-like C-terminal domain-containing protein n=1 Tax=Eleusine coracana subsp. coracana TaxID=191504 RepID=A0AAV5FMZ4_ELECO|nr:hypothetical protein PR202_gb25069 [Eleusine coracana subsp. coracana]
MASTAVSWQPDLELKELRHKLRKFLAAAEKKEAAKHAGVLVQDVMVVPATPTPSTLLFSSTPTPPLPTMEQKSLNDLTLQELLQLLKERLEVRGDKQHPSAEEASKIEVEEVLTPELQIVEGVHVLQIDDGGCLIKSDGHQIEEDNPEVDNKDGHQVAVGDHRIKEEDDHQIGVGDHLINEEGSSLLGPGMQFTYFSARDLFSARSTLPSYNAKKSNSAYVESQYSQSQAWVGLNESIKNQFWEDLDSMVSGIPISEKLFIGGDLNGHVGTSNVGFERVHGGFGYGSRNQEGVDILNWALAYDLRFVRRIQETEIEEALKRMKSGKAMGPDGIPIEKSNPSHHVCNRENEKAAAGFRQHPLRWALSFLKSIAEFSKIPVVVTNQVRSQNNDDGYHFSFEADGKDGTNYAERFDSHLVAALGVQWAHAVIIRLVFESHSGHRFIKVAKSPMSPAVAFPFTVESSGITLLSDEGIDVTGPDITSIRCQGIIYMFCR